MSLAADALQAQVVRGLMSFGGRVPNMTLSEVLTTTNAGYDLAFGSQTVFIDFRQPEFLVGVVAGEYSRFALAALQTLKAIPDEMTDKGSLPWSLIKLYYSAFYAAHALIRLFGQSCSHFNKKQVTQITDFGISTGNPPPFVIKAGLYHCVINASASGWQATGMDGSSHETFWKVFRDWIEQSQRTMSRAVVTLSPTELQEVILKLETLKEIIKANRLSIVRNSLQYRHEYGVWFPIKLSKRDMQALARLASRWNGDPMKIDLRVANTGALGEFVLGCTFIVSLCRTMLKRVAERSTAGKKSFVHFGPLDVLERAGG